jgi:hypothetical protein
MTRQQIITSKMKSKLGIITIYWNVIQQTVIL